MYKLNNIFEVSGKLPYTGQLADGRFPEYSLFFKIFFDQVYQVCLKFLLLFFSTHYHKENCNRMLIIDLL